MAVRRGIVPCGEAHAEPEQRQIWSDAHLRVHFQQPKPRWTWKAVGYLILAFGLAVWLWYEGLN